MAIINCPQCGRQVSSAAPSCLHCGYKFSDYQSRGNYEKKTYRGRNALIGYVVILLAILAVYIIYRTSGSDVGNQNASNPEQIGDSTLFNNSHEDKQEQLKLHFGIEGKEERVKGDKIASPDILGKWYCNTPGVKHTITFFKDGNNLKAKLVWPFDHESIETIREGRNNKYIVTSSKFGEYYILNSSGILELWDMEGKFGIATKE